MKTKEELNALKEEVETMNKKLTELTEDELNEVTGGVLRGKAAGGFRLQRELDAVKAALQGVTAEMEQTGLSFRQSATHSLTISIDGD